MIGICFFLLTLGVKNIGTFLVLLFDLCVVSNLYNCIILCFCIVVSCVVCIVVSCVVCIVVSCLLCIFVSCLLCIVVI